MQSTASMYPSQYREYYRDWKDAYAKNPEIFHDSGFEWLAKHAKRVGGSHKVVDGKIMRVFFPIYIEPTLPDDMQQIFESSNYRVASDSVVLDNHNRQVSINKAFQQLAKKKDLAPKIIKKNLDGYAEELGSSGAMILVVSRHPYDIAGMSTGRAWKSCHTVGGMSPRDKKAYEIARRKFYAENEALRKAAQEEAARSDEYVKAQQSLVKARRDRDASVAIVASARDDLTSYLESPAFVSVLQKNIDYIRRYARAKRHAVLVASLAFFAASIRSKSVISKSDKASFPDWVLSSAEGKAAREQMALDFLSPADDFDDDPFSAKPRFAGDFGDAIVWLYVSALSRKLDSVPSVSRRDFLPDEPRVFIAPPLVGFCTYTDESRSLYEYIQSASSNVTAWWDVISRTISLSSGDVEQELDKRFDLLRERYRASWGAEHAVDAAIENLDQVALRNPAQSEWDSAKDEYFSAAYPAGEDSRLVRQDVVTGSVIAYIIKPKLSLLTSIERAGKVLPKFAEVLESRLDRGNKDPIFEPLGRVIFRTASSRYEDGGRSPIAYLRAGLVYGFGERPGIKSQFKRMAKHLVVTLNKSARRDMAGSDVIPRALYHGDNDTTYDEGDLYGSPHLNYKS